MNYSPFTSFSERETRRGGILGELPSFMTATPRGTLAGGVERSYQYGTSNLAPADAYAAQQKELERRTALQRMAGEEMQQGIQGYQLQSEADKRAVEEAKQFIRMRGPESYKSFSGPAWAANVAQKELELEDIKMQQARMEFEQFKTNQSRAESALFAQPNRSTMQFPSSMTFGYTSPLASQSQFGLGSSSAVIPKFSYTPPKFPYSS